MVANTLIGAVEQELVDWEIEFEARPQSPLEARLSSDRFIADSDSADESLPAGTLREQTIIQIRLMNPGASREMLAAFTDSALGAYLSHLRLAAGPRGPQARFTRDARPGVTRYVPDRD